MPISKRPAEVADRAVPGHWEGDLLCGSKKSQIITLVERHTRYVMLVRTSRKDTETVIKALRKHAQKLPRELYKSLTWDRGSEMADHKKFSLATDIKVYFCDPQYPWQRGSNDNTNALLRQYFPKGMDLSNVHQTDSMQWRDGSMSDQGRPWVIIHLQKNLLNVLRRSIESAISRRNYSANLTTVA